MGPTVRQKLERNDIDQALKTIDSLRNPDDLGIVVDSVIVLIADDD